MHSARSISILAADIVAVRVVAVVVSAVGTIGAVGRGTNRCGAHRRRTVSATWIIPSAVTRATGIDSTSVNASSPDGAAVEASTASVSATTPTARERVVRDEAGCN
jgi:hypothetical protein